MRWSARLLAAALLAAAGCSSAVRTPESPVADVPRFEGLGSHSRPLSAATPEAQRLFDQGLAFLYAFNHDEAARSFRAAESADPSCALAAWGVAVACGPHINNPAVPPAREKEAVEAVARARSRAASASAVERALIEAVAVRHADPPPADRAPLDRAYADAMAQVWAAHPGDPDVGALYAESLMDLQPWDLWTPEGEPKGQTPRILEVLEAVLAASPGHPLANHLYIHAVEASPHPERADAAADRLRTLQPGLGHMVHMPSHIDVRTGRWDKAREQNRLAIEADRAYRERAGVPQGFYRLYMAHNRHMRAFAAMMTGRSGEAIEEIRAMVAEIPPDYARENPFMDGFLGMPFEVLMRFGRWDEILAEPEPDAAFPIARALRLYGRGVALAAKGRPGEARKEQEAFRAAKAAMPPEAFFGNNAAADLMALADDYLEGEILAAEGALDPAIASLRRAAEREDALRYDEPPDWIQPVRHALGAVLLRAGRLAEAEQVYRDDLARLPNNGWSLYGLARSLERQGKDAEAATVQARLDQVWSGADVAITTSCFCQPGAGSPGQPG